MDLVDFEGNHQFAKYRSFQVAGEAEKYMLVLGAFVEGNAGGRLRRAPWPGLHLLGVLALPLLCDVGGDLASPVSSRTR